ncbi:MAG: hypothetical protein AMXMBFR53_07800 [Gemmatimonadota bacterium]
MKAVGLLYRLALLAVPAALRERHGPAMEAAVERAVRSAWDAEGARAAAAAVAAAIWDAVKGGVVQRWDGWKSRRAHGGRGAGMGVGTYDAGGYSMDGLKQDLTFAVRGLLRSPTLAVVAVLTLGLGIGANSALFSVLHGVLLTPLPFPSPERVTHLAWERGPTLRGYTTAYKLEYWQRSTGSFEALTTWSEFSGRLGGEERPEGIRGLRVSHAFFDVVGLHPVLGRGFAASDDVEDAPDVAVIGHGLWTRRFGGSPDALSRSVVIDGRPRQIVGVLPADFAFPQAPHHAEVLLPLRLRPDIANEQENYPILARLRPDVSPTRADEEVRGLTAAFRAEHPDLVHETDRGMRLASYEDLYVGDLGTVLWVLTGATGLVLLIACANVANLLLARAMDRRDELALRRALGASRGRIVAQLSVESAVLTLLSAGVGLLLARWGVDAILALAPSELPRSGEIGLDGTVLGLTLAFAALTGIAFGISASSLMPGDGASPAQRRTATRAAWRSRTRQGLLAVEAALSVVLLMGAGLLVATLQRISSVDPGFDAEGVITARFPVRPDGYAGSRAMWELTGNVTSRLVGDLGVEAVAATSSLPLERGMNLPMTLASDLEQFAGDVEWRGVSPGFFETLGMPIVRGRAFGPDDEAGAPQVVIVNEAFARMYFPGVDPLGQRILIGHYNGRWIAPGFEGPGAVVVGVAADAREISLKSGAKRTMWVPQAQVQDALAAPPIFVVRGPDPAVAAQRLREALAATDARLPVPEIRPLSDVVGSSMAEERFNATLLALFASLALVLTALGIYGAVSYSVRQRRREAGIRIALGAREHQVVGLITLQGLAPVALGLAMGAAASAYLSRFITDLLWEVRPTDPATLGWTVALLLSVGAVAAYLPARSAAGANPRDSLAEE